MKNIAFGKPILGREEREAVLEVMESGTLVHGSTTKAFEVAFSEYLKAPAAVSVASCTAGLHLTYFHLGLKPGDEVIVPAQTHVATAHAVELMGARPVFVDAESQTGNMDVDQLERAITPRTRAISVVHYLGVPVDMVRVSEIAQRHSLFVVEDCALALGSRLDGRAMGLWGDVGCFSFYPVKHMTTAEGGMITCRSTALAEQLSRKKAFGYDKNVGERPVPGLYDVQCLGLNYRMNEIEAALGLVQLQRLDGFLGVRKRNFARLAQGLRDIKGIQVLETSDPRFESSHYCLAFVLQEGLSHHRNDLLARLKNRGIGTSIYYPGPVPVFRYYREKYGHQPKDFPVASWISNSSVALPVAPHVTSDDIDHIIDAVREETSSLR